MLESSLPAAIREASAEICIGQLMLPVWKVPVATPASLNKQVIMPLPWMNRNQNRAQAVAIGRPINTIWTETA